MTTPTTRIEDTHELAPPLVAGRRTIEFREPAFSDLAVTLAVTREQPDGSRSYACVGLRRHQVEQLIARLQRILDAARPPERAKASTRAVDGPPARPARVEDVRVPGEPPASWRAMQSAGGTSR